MTIDSGQIDQQAGEHRYELSDRFRLEDGRCSSPAVQALARLAVDQLRIDRRHGLHTAAFVSGYQGSPVGTFTEECVGVADRPRPADRRPTAVNEELAATAVMGSQLAMTLDDTRYDGVVGIWYGKAPGLDRASDAIRHAVFAGTLATAASSPSSATTRRPSRRRCRRRATPRSSTCTCRSSSPATCRRRSTSSRHAVALSRASGIWVGLKLVTAGRRRHRHRRRPPRPRASRSSRRWSSTASSSCPHPSGRLLTPYTFDMEREFQRGPLGAGPPLRRRQPAQPRSPRTADDWIGIAAAATRTTSCARRCACSGSPPTTTCAPPASGCSSC